MNSKTVDKIIALNKDFYEAVGQDFSRTRQNPWKGWFELLPLIRKQFAGRNSISVLDIACGNGRFYDFLKNNLPEFNIEYMGLDNNESLLQEARLKSLSGSVYYNIHNVIKDLDSAPGAFDLVVAFGITHHIPSNKLRKNWFLELSNKLNPSGLFVFTVWNYMKSNRSSRNIKPVPAEIDEQELEEGDYFIGWADTDAVRYVHDYSDREILEALNPTGLTLQKNFKADGKNNELNEYRIYSKKKSLA